MVKMFNKSVTVKAKLTDSAAEDVILMYEAWFRKSNYNV